MTNPAPQPGRPSRLYREGAPIFKRVRQLPADPDRVRDGEVCLREAALRELIIAARDAVRLINDITAHYRSDNIPEVKRLLAACKLAEKAARKPANDMRKD